MVIVAPLYKHALLKLVYPAFYFLPVVSSTTATFSEIPLKQKVFGLLVFPEDEDFEPDEVSKDVFAEVPLTRAVPLYS